MSTALISLFQLTDSFFPSGAFAHSWAVETFVAEGGVNEVQSFHKLVEDYILHNFALCDALAMKLSHEYTDRGDIEGVCRLDRKLHTMKMAKETRQGSIHTGRHLLRLMIKLKDMEELKEFLEQVNRGQAHGHHSVAFGMYCSVSRLNLYESVLAFLYTHVSSLVSAGVRLVPFGHTDGQRVIEGLKPLLVQTAERILPLKEDELSCFAPGIEIRAMRHERLYTRLFKS